MLHIDSLVTTNTRTYIFLGYANLSGPEHLASVLDNLYLSVAIVHQAHIAIEVASECERTWPLLPTHSNEQYELLALICQAAKVGCIM